MSRKISVSFIWQSGIILIAFFTPGIILSQQVQEAPDDSVRIDDIVIRAGTILENDPATFQVLTNEQISAIYFGQDPSAVLMNLSPSILSYSDAGSHFGNYNQFRMRGIDQTRIHTTLNGIPLNDMIDQGVYFSNFSDLLNSIKEIEVLRGAGATTSGLASFAGAVNFESTRSYQEEPSASIELSAGSFNSLRTSAEINTGQMAKGFQAYSRFTRSRSDGYKFHSGSDALSFFGSAGFTRENDIIRITGFAGKTQNDQSYLPVLVEDIRSEKRTNYNHPNDTDDFEQELVMAEYGRSIPGNSSLQLTAYYGGARGVFPFGLDDQTQLAFGLENKRFGISSNITYEKNTLRLRSGFNAYLIHRDNFNYVAPNISTPDYSDETTKRDFNLFGKLNYDISSFNLYADVQFRWVYMNFLADEILSFGGPVPDGIDQDRDWFFPNFKIGVTGHIEQDHSWFFSFARTGREPTRTDILQGDGSAISEFNLYSLIDETVVKPEYVNDFEAGYQFKTESVYISGNLFYMLFENEISQVGALADFSYIPLRQNVGNSLRAGLEITGNWVFNDDLSFSLNGTWLTTKVKSFQNNNITYDNVKHIFSPSWIIQPAMKFSPVEALNIQLSGRYVSESYLELSNNPSFTIPSYFTMGIDMNWKITDSSVIRLSVDNIFDELYYNDGAPVDLDFDGIVEGPGYRIQPPRNFFMTVSYAL